MSEDTAEQHAHRLLRVMGHYDPVGGSTRDVHPDDVDAMAFLLRRLYRRWDNAQKKRRPKEG